MAVFRQSSLFKSVGFALVSIGSWSLFLTLSSSLLTESVEAGLVKELHYGKGGGLDIECGPDELILIESERLAYSPTSSGGGGKVAGKGPCPADTVTPSCSVPYSQASWFCRGKSSCSGMPVERRPLHKRTCGSDFTNCLRVEYRCVKTNALTNICSNVVYETLGTVGGHIVSPRFPDMYPAKRNCTCTITTSGPTTAESTTTAAPTSTRADASNDDDEEDDDDSKSGSNSVLANRGTGVRLGVGFFLIKSTNPCRDWLSIQMDGLPPVRRCGFLSNVEQYFGKTAVINFRSDRSQQDMGFWLYFKGNNADQRVTLRCGKYAFLKPATTTTATTTTTAAPKTSSTRTTSTSFATISPRPILLTSSSARPGTEATAAFNKSATYDNVRSMLSALTAKNYQHNGRETFKELSDVEDKRHDNVQPGQVGIVQEEAIHADKTLNRWKKFRPDTGSEKKVVRFSDRKQHAGNVRHRSSSLKIPVSSANSRRLPLGKLRKMRKDGKGFNDPFSGDLDKNVKLKHDGLRSELNQQPTTSGFPSIILDVNTASPLKNDELRPKLNEKRPLEDHSSVIGDLDKTALFRHDGLMPEVNQKEPMVNYRKGERINEEMRATTQSATIAAGWEVIEPGTNYRTDKKALEWENSHEEADLMTSQKMNPGLPVASDADKLFESRVDFLDPNTLSHPPPPVNDVSESVNITEDSSTITKNFSRPAHSAWIAMSVADESRGSAEVNGVNGNRTDSSVEQLQMESTTVPAPVAQRLIAESSNATAQSEHVMSVVDVTETVTQHAKFVSETTSDSYITVSDVAMTSSTVALTSAQNVTEPPPHEPTANDTDSLSNSLLSAAKETGDKYVDHRGVMYSKVGLDPPSWQPGEPYQWLEEPYEPISRNDTADANEPDQNQTSTTTTAMTGHLSPTSVDWTPSTPLMAESVGNTTTQSNLEEKGRRKPEAKELGDLNELGVSSVEMEWLKSTVEPSSTSDNVDGPLEPVSQSQHVTPADDALSVPSNETLPAGESLSLSAVEQMWLDQAADALRVLDDSKRQEPIPEAVAVETNQSTLATLTVTATTPDVPLGGTKATQPEMASAYIPALTLDTTEPSNGEVTGVESSPLVANFSNDVFYEVPMPIYEQTTVEAVTSLPDENLDASVVRSPSHWKNPYLAAASHNGNLDHETGYGPNEVGSLFNHVDAVPVERDLDKDIVVPMFPVGLEPEVVQTGEYFADRLKLITGAAAANDGGVLAEVQHVPDDEEKTIEQQRQQQTGQEEAQLFNLNTNVVEIPPSPSSSGSPEMPRPSTAWMHPVSQRNSGGTYLESNHFTARNPPTESAQQLDDINDNQQVFHYRYPAHNDKNSREASFTTTNDRKSTLPATSKQPENVVSEQSTASIANHEPEVLPIAGHAAFRGETSGINSKASAIAGGQNVIWAVIVVGTIGWLIFVAMLGVVIYNKRKRRRDRLYSSRSQTNSVYSDFHLPAIPGMLPNSASSTPSGSTSGRDSLPGAAGRGRMVGSTASTMTTLRDLDSLGSSSSASMLAAASYVSLGEVAVDSVAQRRAGKKRPNVKRTGNASDNLPDRKSTYDTLPPPIFGAGSKTSIAALQMANESTAKHDEIDDHGTAANSENEANGQTGRKRHQDDVISSDCAVRTGWRLHGLMKKADSSLQETGHSIASTSFGYKIEAIGLSRGSPTADEKDSANSRPDAELDDELTSPPSPPPPLPATTTAASAASSSTTIETDDNKTSASDSSKKARQVSSSISSATTGKENRQSQKSKKNEKKSYAKANSK